MVGPDAEHGGGDGVLDGLEVTVCHLRLQDRGNLGLQLNVHGNLIHSMKS